MKSKVKKEFKPDVCGESPPRTKTSKGQLSNCVIAYRCSRTSTKEHAIFSSIWQRLLLLLLAEVAVQVRTEVKERPVV